MSIDTADTTGWTLTQMDTPGGRITLRIKRRPQHERAIKGIIAGAIGGMLIWAFVVLTVWACWRAWPIVEKWL